MHVLVFTWPICITIAFSAKSNHFHTIVFWKNASAFPISANTRFLLVHIFAINSILSKLALLPPMQEEKVILVDALDNEIGQMEKLEAHEKGQLHRAFSVFLYNEKGEMLLQRRAFSKYHSAGLWTNTCCSHPRPGEGNLQAAHRRLMEEMGIQAEVAHAFSFLYHQAVGNLIEHELDHVFIGQFDGAPNINTEEVAEWKFISPAALKADLEQHPENYTVWFRLCVDRVEKFRANETLSTPATSYIS